MERNLAIMKKNAFTCQTISHQFRRNHPTSPDDVSSDVALSFFSAAGRVSTLQDAIISRNYMHERITFMIISIGLLVTLMFL